MMRSKDLAARIREFVRADIPWEELEPDLQSQGLSISVTWRPARNVISEQNSTGLVTHVELADLATGLLRLARNRDRLEKWAFLVLSASFVDYPEATPETNEEVLIEALWDASFREPLSQETVDRIRTLTE